MIRKAKIEDSNSIANLILRGWQTAYKGLIDQEFLDDMQEDVYVSADNKKLSLQLYQRSADTFLGVPFNIASYSLLLMMVAQVCGLQPYEMVHTFGDLHIYNDHVDLIKEQLTRTPRKLPKVILNPDIKNIEDFKFEDIQLVDYDPYPAIKGKVSV